jgi:hypothetical protein
MNRKLIAAVAGALALGASLAAPAQEIRYDDQYVYRLGRAPDWNLNADSGSVCTQPLPFGHVDDFRITANEARGRIVEVRTPDRRNNFTGGMVIEDPQPGPATYDLVVSWRNVNRPGVPLAANDPFPYFDETRACQERVRSEFLARNEGDAYLEFTGSTDRDDAGANRESIRGRAFARNRNESRMLTYECVLNDRTNRVLSASYDLRGPARYSSLQ